MNRELTERDVNVLKYRLAQVEGKPNTAMWVEENPEGSESCRLIKCSNCGSTFIVGNEVSYDDWVGSDIRRYCGCCGRKMVKKYGKVLLFEEGL